MRLTLVRHGETTDNAKGILMGQASGRLSALGKLQSVLVAKRLKNEHFDIIYCSDLKRCKDTLKEIAKYHKRVPVIFSKDLRERHIGIFQGKPRQKLHEAFLKYKKDPQNFKPKGGESVNELIARVNSFVLYLKQNHQGENVLVIAHGGILRAVNSILKGAPFNSDFRFYNASVSAYHFQGKKITIPYFNDTSHL